MRNLLFALLAVTAIIGCKGPQESIKTTVVVHHDTLFSKEIHKDSTIHNIYSRDTIYIRDSKLTIKYLYKGDSNAYISGTMLRDTIVRIDSVKSKITTIIKEVAKPKTGFENFCEWIVMIALIFLMGKYVGLPIAKAFVPKLPF